MTDTNVVQLPTYENEIRTSEDRLATELASMERKNMRYVEAWSRWMVFNGSRWLKDEMNTVFDRVRMYLRDIARLIVHRMVGRVPNDDEIGDRKTKAGRAVKSLLSSSTIHNVARLMRYDPSIAGNVEQWDRDPTLLNTPMGTVDLKTGETRRANPLDYITHETAIGPMIGQPKLWLEVLNTSFKGDERMISYLKKIFGYCLVGQTVEHQMYFAYGTGANGKSVLINTFRDILGTYGTEANIETFIHNDNSRHPTELAALRGSRFVTCGETDAGQRWNEGRIKQLTGGDPIKARFLYQDEFEYKPQFKLFLAGNHKPRLRNIDEAIQRRFRLIPFTHTIPSNKRDPYLTQKLRDEWPYILHWAIEGALEWKDTGLQPPDAVAEATKSYLSQEDAIMVWIGECTEFGIGGDVYTELQTLYDSWRKWASDNGEQPGTKRSLSATLEDREPLLQIKKHRRGNMGFLGIRLKGK